MTDFYEYFEDKKKRNPYEVLGVPRHYKLEEIREVYLRLTRAHHPDKHNDSPEEKEFWEKKQAELNEAWEILSKERKELDQYLDGHKGGVYDHRTESDYFSEEESRKEKAKEEERRREREEYAKGSTSSYTGSSAAEGSGGPYEYKGGYSYTEPPKERKSNTKKILAIVVIVVAIISIAAITGFSMPKAANNPAPQLAGSQSNQYNSPNQNNPTPPNLTLYSPSITGRRVTINGVTNPTTQGASITQIKWDWGDGQSSIGWFPQSHTYSNSGVYTIKTTSYDSNGSWRSITESVSVSSPAQSPINNNNNPVMYSSNTNLSSDVYCSNLTIEPGVTVFTNGFGFYCSGTFDNEGTIVAGLANNAGGGNELNSYGGSGGAAGSGLLGGGQMGGSTTIVGGSINTDGGPGITPNAPALSNGLLFSWYESGMQQHLAGGGGGNANCANPCYSGSGSSGVYIQANKIVAGTIYAEGQSASGAGPAGGGGGGFILLSYGTGGYTPGNYFVQGGGYACGAFHCGGRGGAGQVVAYPYGVTPPIGYKSG